MEEKIPFSVTDLSISLLSDNDDLSKFSCGTPELDAFFHNEAKICMRYKYIAVYSAKWNGEIVSLFTLTHDSVLFTSGKDKEDFVEESCYNVNEEYRDVYVQQSFFPAINIGHLATRTDMQSKGIGKFIIDFVAETFLDYKIAGCQFIVVDSLNNKDTNRFYTKNGFSFQMVDDAYNSTRRMYLPLKMFRD